MDEEQEIRYTLQETCHTGQLLKVNIYTSTTNLGSIIYCSLDPDRYYPQHEAPHYNLDVY